jgi:hypothetical protein
MLELHLAGKTTKKKQNSNTPNPQPGPNFCTPRYTEKPGRLLCHQTLAPNLPRRCKPTGETTTELMLKYQHQDWMLKE